MFIYLFILHVLLLYYYYFPVLLSYRLLTAVDDVDARKAKEPRFIIRNNKGVSHGLIGIDKRL